VLVIILKPNTSFGGQTPARSFVVSICCFVFTFQSMVKQYLAEIGIHPTKLQAFQQGNGVTITPDDLSGGSLFHAHFSKLKHLNE
jgi:hypothetical protein